MKKRLKRIGALCAVALTAFGYCCWSDRSLRASVEETRRQVREQGLRTDLSDFDFALSAEISARASEIIAAGKALESLSAANEFRLREMVGTNAALAVSSIETIKTVRAANLWAPVQQELAPHNEKLDRVCASLFAGPVKFSPQVTGDIRLPHLAGYKRLARALAIRAVVEMHKGDANGVFTNLLALSRMVTAWTPEPAEMSHLVRFACAGIAEPALWESLQTASPNEAQLAALQREWESARFLESLPETMELSCASMVRLCQSARKESYGQNIGGWGPVLRGVLTAPATGCRNLWSALQGYREHASYRDRGSFEDEKALLLYHRERHQELKRCAACSTWAEMRLSPGATNVVAFQGSKPSRIQSIMNLKRIGSSFQGKGRTLMACAAEAETKRRLIVTALALQRFAIRHQEYPQSLAQLVPDWLPAVPLDFMDGKELRYRRFESGSYVLYSVGLDGVDNGGQMVTSEYLSNARRPRREETFLPYFDTDIVWPRRANQEDMDLSGHSQKTRWPREPQ